MRIKNRIDPASRVSAVSAIANKEDILRCISRLLIFRFILLVSPRNAIILYVLTLERCLRVRKSTIENRVYVKSVPRVRIPLSARFKTTLSGCLFVVSCHVAALMSHVAVDPMCYNVLRIYCGAVKKTNKILLLTTPFAIIEKKNSSKSETCFEATLR